MKFEIKQRWSGAVLFRVETDSLRLAVEVAVKGRANLSGADLSRAHLSGANLSGAHLSGAHLSGANMYGANLSRAHLSGADLSRADLSGANLSRANLSGANLSRAHLYGANLSGANLSRAHLYGANLSSAHLYGANLYGANGEKMTLVGDRPYLQIGPLGSRTDYLQAWLTDKGVYLRAGCFWNTLKAFKAAVAEMHGTRSVHAKEYALAIKQIEAHARLWQPKKEAK